MGYIKVSDPSIIDLGAWHQVIQVVNQHSDSIASITNNFNTTSATTTTNADGIQGTYDPVSQQIQYGRVIMAAGAHTVDVAFPVAFTSSQPMVVATVYTNTTGNQGSVVTVGEITTTGFKITTQGNVGVMSINWIAIGTK